MTEQQCTKCNICKPSDHFSWRNKAKGKKNSWCRDCHRLYEVRKYASSPDERERKRINRERQRSQLRSFILEYLEGHPCVDCGQTDMRVLEFDHRDPTHKIAEIAEMMHRQRSIKAVQQEIQKCDVRCANCHRIRTAEQFGYWKYTTGTSRGV